MIVIGVWITVAVVVVVVVLLMFIHLDHWLANCVHMIVVCLSGQSAPEKHNQEKEDHKPLRAS